MTIKRISPSKWEVRVSVGGTHNRKQYRRTITGTKEDAKRLEAQFFLDAGKPLSEESLLTLEEFVFNRWLPSAQISESTRVGYERHMHKISSRLGHLFLKQITPQALESYFNSCTSPGVAHKQYVTLRTALNTAVRWQVLESNPCSRMRPPRKPPTKSPDVYSPEQLRLIMQEVRGQWFEPLWLLGAFCGLRPEESTALDVPPRDWNGVLEIERAYSSQGKNGWQLTKLKTDASRATVFVPQEIAERILEITEGMEGPLGRMVKCGPNGHRANREVFARTYKRFCIDRGLPHIPPKNLRHTAATLMLNSGVALPVVSKILRHTQISTTVNSYLGLIDGAKKEAAESFAAQIIG